MPERQTIIGCCGWSEAKPKYFADFQAVEVQSTFYDLPAASLVAKWRAMAPDEFLFYMKAWQLITHTSASPTYRKLKSKLSAAEAELVGSFRPTEQVALAWERTAAIAAAMRARVVLFQCPASFAPEPKNVRNLRAFFSTIDRHGLQLAWEPRGDWDSDVVRGLCSELQLIHCVDPFDVAVEDVGAPYWRLHGKGAYSYRYSEDDLKQLSMFLGDGEPRHIFFNNIWMKDDAMRFKQLLAAAR